MPVTLEARLSTRALASRELAARGYCPNGFLGPEAALLKELATGRAGLPLLPEAAAEACELRLRGGRPNVTGRPSPELLVRLRAHRTELVLLLFIKMEHESTESGVLHKHKLPDYARWGEFTRRSAGFSAVCPGSRSKVTS